MTVTVQAPSPAARVDGGHRRLFSALLVVGGLSVVARLAFVARDLVVAGQFGTSEDLDAYLLAFTFPSFGVAVISGSFNSALIPTLIQVQHDEGRPAAQRLLSNATTINTALLTLTLGAFGLLAPYVLPLLGSHFTPAALLLARRLTFILLPSLILSGLSTTWSAVLNAEGRFAVAAIAPAGTALVPLVLLLVAPPPHRVVILSIGTVLGYAAEAGVIGVALWRRGFSLMPAWHGLDLPTRTVLRQYLPVVAGSFIMSTNTLVNQGLAGMLGPSTISSLSYGTKMVSLVVGIGALSIGSAVLPHFSRQVAVGDIAGIRHTVRICTRVVLAGSLPIVLGFIYFSRPIVALVFQRGAFTAHDADVVAAIQQAYVLQIPSYLLGMMFVRLVSSLKANHVILWATVMNLTVNIVLGYTLARAIGPVGIALTTSAVSIISCSFVALMTFRHLRRDKLVVALPEIGLA